MCECGVQISFEKEETTCEICGQRYKRVDQDRIEPARPK
jgi:hypothetical protein